MRIGWFFPSMILATAAMTWGAIAPGLEGQRELEDQLFQVRTYGYVVDGRRLSNFRETGGVSYSVIEGGALTRVTMNAQRAALDGPTTNAGVFITLPPPVAHVFAGQPTRVTITARRAPEDGASQFSAAYFIARTTSSSWRHFQPTSRFSDFSFEWTPPESTNNNATIIGVAPDTSGGLGAIEVLRIRVELVTAPTPASPVG